MLSRTDFPCRSNIDNSYLAEQLGSETISGWGNGDFNYDGVVDGSDYTLIDNAFNNQGVSMTDSIATTTAQISGSPAVPEPTGIFILSVGALGLVGRRRRISNVQQPCVRRSALQGGPPSSLIEIDSTLLVSDQVAVAGF